MRLTALVLAAVAAIISGCQANHGVRGYWSYRTIDLENVAAAEDEFARFAELAVQAPLSDALPEVDRLLKKAGKDEVAFLVYSEWFIRSFSSLASPCHNCPIFVHAADRILDKGALSDFEADEFRRRREFCLHNQVGDNTELPLLPGGGAPDIPLDKRTLFLVVDQDCSSCREAMGRFLSPEWEGTELVAFCYGSGSLPDIDGWRCLRIDREQAAIDVRQAPFYFVNSPNGTIELSYTSAYNEQL